MKKHYKIEVEGRVQGVGYRFSCTEAASKHRINGTVKNRTDGSVYIEAEGEEGDLAEFIAWCRKGPMWSKVSSLKLEEGDVCEFDAFQITR